MNIVLWSDDVGLRETVIVNPISFFINPAATIICKLAPTEGDPTLHLSEVHRACQQSQPEQFADLVDNGLLHNSLLQPLLLDKCAGDVKALETVVRLLVKYSLLVPMTEAAPQAAPASAVIPGVKMYIAPLLLPDVRLAPHLLGNYHF
jgi:hypothetical protein